MPLGQIINVQEPSSAWANFGSGLGQGLSQAAGMMVNQKLNDMLQQKQLAMQHAEWFREAEGIGTAIGRKDLIPHIAAMGPENFKYISQNFGLEALDDLKSKIESGVSDSTEPGYRSLEARQLSTTGPGSNIGPVGQAMGQNQRSPSIQQQEALQAEKAQAQNSQMMAQGIAPNIKGIPESQTQPDQIQDQETPVAHQPMSLPTTPITEEGQPKRAMTAEEFNREVKKLPPKDRAGARNFWMQQKKAEREERALATKEKVAEYTLEGEQRKYISKVNDEYNSTLKKRPIYKTMASKAVELQPQSVTKKFLMDKFDLPAGWMLNPTEQVLEKVSNQLLRGISGDYKGRILQSEVENYTKSNPSLLNTPEGMQKLAKISMALDDVTEQKWKIKNDIVKEYRKKRKPLPEDIETQVLEKSAGYAEDAYRKVEELMQQKGLQGTLDLKEGAVLDSLPKATQAGKNAVVEDTSTGQRYISDGQTWRKLRR